MSTPFLASLLSLALATTLLAAPRPSRVVDPCWTAERPLAEARTSGNWTQLFQRVEKLEATFPEHRGSRIPVSTRRLEEVRRSLGLGP